MGRLVYSLLVSVLLIYASPSLAAKILILTDQPSQKRAKELKSLFSNLPPFSLFKELEVSIRLIPKGTAKCSKKLLEKITTDQPMESGGVDTKRVQQNIESVDSSMPASCRMMNNLVSRENAAVGKDKNREKVADAQAALQAAQRNMECDTSSVLMETAGEENADRTIFIKDSEEWAGAGGSFITITTAMPATIGVHELMHTFGFSDEYGFASECEADIYCPRLEKNGSPNLAIFMEVGPYRSDTAARKLHQAHISWFGKIKPRTLITSGAELGTPQKNEIGIFRVATCDKATSKVSSWRPGSSPTIMGDAGNELIPEIYWERIAQSLGYETPKPIKTSRKYSAPRGSTK